MHKAVSILMLFVAAHPFAADASFWVSVGSFQDAAVAARVAHEASTALNKTFSVQLAETASGTMQRVATGPFDSRDDAQAALDRARTGGYPDSWIFNRPADDPTVAVAGAAADDSNLARVLNDDSTDVDTGRDLNAMEDDLINRPQHQRTLQEALKEVKEIPTEIPPGYRLNYLFRDGEPAPPETDQ